MQRKLLSLMLAAAMAVSVMSPVASPAFAEEAQTQVATLSVEGEKATDEGAQSDDAAVDTTDDAAQADKSAWEQAGELFEALPAAEEVLAMSAEEKAAVSEQTAAALNAVDALSLEDYDLFMAQYGEVYDLVCTDLMAALMAQAEPENTPTDLSLQPMEETTGVYLPIYGYTKEEMQNFPVDNIPGMLVDEDGVPLQIDSNYTSVWFYFASDEVEEYHALGNGETIDLWDYKNYSEVSSISWAEYPLYVVLGTGDQMDGESCHRYITTVYLRTWEQLSWTPDFDLDAANGTDIFFLPNCRDTDLFDTLGMEGRLFDCYLEGHTAGTNYLVNTVTEEAIRQVERLQHSGIRLDVYPMANFLAHRDGGAPLTGAITDQILTTESGKGYLANFDAEITSENYTQVPNLFCIVLTDIATGQVVGCFGLGITVKSLSGRLSGNMYNGESGPMQPLGTSRESSGYLQCWSTIDLSKTADMITVQNNDVVWHLMVTLPTEYSISEDYYFALNKIDEIKAVYTGSYNPNNTVQESGVYDITDQVLYDGTQQAPFGYKACYKANPTFTIVLEDGQVQKLLVGASNFKEGGNTSGPVSPDETISYNEIDPDFEVSGVALKGSNLDYYIAKAVGGIQMDTYYRNDERYDVGGYQLVMIKERLTAEGLKSLVPSFLTPQGVTVSSGSPVKSGVTDLSKAVWSDSMANTVMYQVQVPGKKLKNYQVTFATLQDKGTLYVAGPDERFVNLTGDNNYVHDILVANIGATDLSGVKVELINPVHVALDEYWTLQGQTIPAFTQTAAYYDAQSADGTVVKQLNGYATPDNIAKVRLLADGEGEISGTLRITTADGQKREIKLTGIAANPRIVSAQLEDAVKYVPYSYMVVTDNMYKWNRTMFQLVEGTLPAGMRFYASTGEIYGIPTETGDFTFTIRADYSNSDFESSIATYTLHVADNTNRMVYEQTDPGYEILVPLGVEQGEGTYDFVLSDISTDQLYVSNGVYPEFVGLWLNGYYLTPGTDYTSESGSTRITIKSQTLQNKVITDGYNTIAAEFRVDGDRDNELKRTAQNFRVGDIQTSDPGDSGSDNGGSGSDNGGSGSDNGGSSDSSAGSDNGGAAGSESGQGTAAQAAQGVTLRFYVVDEQDAPLSGVSVELHSTPRYGTTDANGCVVFSGVEFGPHTLTVYDKDGKLLASKTFELVQGAFGTNGDTITVMGGSTLSIRVKAASGQLNFTSVDLPQTGDESNLMLWIGLVFVLACAAAGTGVYRKKQRRSQNETVKE